MSTSPTQPREADESINSAQAEPADRRGKDLRAPCIGCRGLHLRQSEELLCLRDCVTSLRQTLSEEGIDRVVAERVDALIAQGAGPGLCTVSCCQRKATLCAHHGEARVRGHR